jgi:hypothetical protein
MTHQYGETPPNVFDDFRWVREHERELLEKYGECSIIVYQQKVIGVGESYEAAVADAERNLLSDTEEVTPIHQWLRRRHPFFRVQPK